ncbi:MAG: arginine--tRNA ligase [Thermoplasmata archaeon]|nr:arginine--tRNA ligase [Thermoplasmatales archaeon]PMP73652.1 MAG: arginine--tRNA ligase [Aciduliprofundum sp.]
MFGLEGVRKSLEESIKEVIREKFSLEMNVVLERPPEGFGDFSYPLYDLVKNLRKSPEELGKIIISSMDLKNIERVEIKGNYLNFYADSLSISEDFINKIRESGREALNFERKNRKVILEHTSANPTGPLHVGRGRNPIIGDTIGRLLKKYGYDVETHYYVNDAGRQSAILVYGYKNLKLDVNEKKSDHRLVPYYQKASELIENDDQAKLEIEKIMNSVERGDVNTIMENREILGLVLEGIKQTLSRINVSFDRFYWETDLILNGSVKRVLEMLRDDMKEEEGAYYIEVELKGKREKVFLKRKDGTSLYFTRDIAYHLVKSELGDEMINVLGEDHKPHAEMLLQVLKKIKGNINIRNVFYSFVALPEGRMSTRRGRVVYLDDLIEESVEKAREEIIKRRNDLDPEAIETLSEKIGTGAVRFNILKIQSEKKLVFKWEEALNFEGDSSPFLQYSYARASSILRKESWKGQYSKDLVRDQAEVALLKMMLQYPEVIEDASRNLRPYRVAKYAIDLASAFNIFYTQCPVLKEREELKQNRLAMVHAFRLLMGDLLDLMGIEHPEEI